MLARPIVYIAGPYSQGDALYNTHRAMDMADVVLQKGGFPVIPHLSHFWHKRTEKPYEWWLKYDERFLYMSHFLLRMKGHSNGADKEVALAQLLLVPVIYEADIVGTIFTWSVSHEERRKQYGEEAIQNQGKLARGAACGLQMGYLIGSGEAFSLSCPGKEIGPE